jgi:hypothetical protein
MNPFERYSYWTQPKPKEKDRLKTALAASSSAIDTTRNSTTHGRMMAQAVFSVEFACYTDDKKLQKIIAAKFDEIDKAIQAAAKQKKGRAA